MGPHLFQECVTTLYYNYKSLIMMYYSLISKKSQIAMEKNNSFCFFIWGGGGYFIQGLIGVSILT